MANKGSTVIKVVIFALIVIAFIICVSLAFAYIGGSSDFYQCDESEVSRSKREIQNKIKHRCHPVEASELKEYIELVVDNGELEREFKSVPLDQTAPWVTGSNNMNRLKNRYPSIPAYDHSRVVLKIDSDKSASETDYINANWIDSYNIVNRYIATQGPLTRTFTDFWRMIWQNNVRIVVMLTPLVDEDGTVKCDKYWPEVSHKYGSIHVSLHDTETHAQYTIRTFKVIHDGESRTVTHYHFTAWPDMGVPNLCHLLAFIQRVHSDTMFEDEDKPIAVHCSGGVGRTGTFLLIEAMLEMSSKMKQVDFLAHLTSLRKARVDTVEKAEQYKFAHMVVDRAIKEQKNHKAYDCME